MQSNLAQKIILIGGSIELADLRSDQEQFIFIGLSKRHGFCLQHEGNANWKIRRCLIKHMILIRRYSIQESIKSKWGRLSDVCSGGERVRSHRPRWTIEFLWRFHCPQSCWEVFSVPQEMTVLFFQCVCTIYTTTRVVFIRCHSIPPLKRITFFVLLWMSLVLKFMRYRRKIMMHAIMTSLETSTSRALLIKRANTSKASC